VAGGALGLGRIGVWSRGLRYGRDRAAAAAAASELEGLGYGAVWLPDTGGDVLGAVAGLLDATASLTVATGILNIWMHEPGDVARGCAALHRDHPGRFVLGLGASHEAIVKERYARPLSKMRDYLDALDGAEPPVAPDRRVLAALGPRMLELARERAAGAHPYLVTPEHTVRAREVLGAGRVLAVEQSVLLERDAARGLAQARAFVADYLQLPNYVANLRRLGYGDDDLGPSDRLVRALVAFGDEEPIAARVRSHFDAGADHVCVQVIGARDDLALDQWRRLAPALVNA
jgi:probable F420-dependent oxidoreductase